MSKGRSKTGKRNGAAVVEKNGRREAPVLPTQETRQPDRVAEPQPAYTVPLPQQTEFFKIPARFGHVPVAEEPLGYDNERKFEHHYPRIELPFQVVDVVKTGAEKLGEVTEFFPQGRNRLFFGDCLHVMRMLPSESIDLIYIDPPFFSGRNYNIIFGDKNEVRSFSDIWEGGMPGYLIWLNARLYEMKRLLKPTGSIYVHLDWHASHYVKCEMDKIFSHSNFQSEIVWKRTSAHSDNATVGNTHDTLLLYSAGPRPKWNPSYTPYDPEYIEQYYRYKDPDGRRWRSGDATAPGGRGPSYEWKGIRRAWRYTKDRMEQLDRDGRIFYTRNGIPRLKQYLEEMPGIPLQSMWNDKAVQSVNSWHQEAIGYPTQKPEGLLGRIIRASSASGDVVADFFCGGGTTMAVAQRLGRRWIGCDISRVAVALTADRIARILAPNLQEIKRATKVPKPSKGGELFEEIVGNPTLTSVEDAKKKAVETSPLRETGFSVEHWGIYEIQRLTKLPQDQFRDFVLKCYGARKWTGSDPNIHGVKGNELLWIAGPKETDVVTAQDVKGFAQAVMRSRKPEERQAVMIGWNIDPKARAYAEQVMVLGEQKPIQFIKLRLWPLAGEEFKAHVTRKHDKYKDFFAFILPPDVPRIGVTRLGSLKYRFDVSEARSMNTGGKIVNVQWDFDFRDGIFSATQGYSLCRKERKGRGESGFEGEMTVEYTFEEVMPNTEVAIACRVQDDLGGEGMRTLRLKVE